MIAGFFFNFMVYVYKNKLFTLQYSYSSNLIISCELECFQLDCLQIEQRPSAKYGLLESVKGLSPILKLQQLLASPKYCIHFKLINMSLSERKQQGQNLQSFITIVAHYLCKGNIAKYVKGLILQEGVYRNFKINVYRNFKIDTSRDPRTFRKE